MSSAARELRYRNQSGVYGNLAYDLDLEVRERALRHAGEAPRNQESAQPAEKPQVRRAARAQVRQRQHLSLLSVVGFGAVTALAVLVLLSYVQLTAISADTVALKNQLAELETKNVALTTQHEQLFDLDAVKETAEAAGMSKPSSSQIYYVDLSDGDSVVVYQQEEPGILSRLLTSLNHGIYAVVEYFD